ncbi:MAG TPA: class I adenylate-forming enzyme family protein, partial [Acidimicrobiales bacterium]|nr:class I adenylate-forming enzyme family protein [Acidimicrobiales bacterium]
MTPAPVPTVVPGTVATVPEMMDATVDRIGEREAYVEVATGQRLTFREWVRAADGVAAHLEGMGLGRGDVVAISLPPSIDYAIACAAVIRLGGVATGINTRLGPREVSSIFGRCRPRAVIRPDGVASPPGPAMEVCRSELAEAARPVRGASRGPSPPAVGALRAEDPAVIIWTSGTTGLPKGAWFDHRNLAAAVQTAGAMTAPFDRRISGIPMAHAGYMAKLWEHLAFGVTLVLT